MADFDLIYKSDLLADYQEDLCGHIPCLECPFLVPNGHGFTECSLERYISEQPTVDAEPVRHGRWMHLSNTWGECSVCGERNKYLKRWNYCPHCGAKMDGERREDG